jgi:hypothetical protein
VDEIQRIVLQVQNERDLVRLNDQLRTQKETMAELLKLHERQGYYTQAQGQMFQATAQGIGDSQRDIKTLMASQKGMIGAMGAMQIGYALQDFTASQGGWAQKFMGITNNLQMLAVSMGIGGGWFIAISGLIAALQGLAANGDKIASWFQGLDPDEVRKAGEKIKANLEKWKQMEGRPADGEGKAADLTGEAITEGGQKATAKGLAEALRAANVQLPMNADQVKRMNSAGMYNDIWKAIPDVGPFSGLKKSAQEQYDKFAESIYGEQVNSLMVTAQEKGPAGDNARLTLKRAMEGNPNAFPAGVARKVTQAIRGFSDMPSDPGIGPGRQEWHGQLDRDQEKPLEYLPTPTPGVFSAPRPAGTKTPENVERERQAQEHWERVQRERKEARDPERQAAPVGRLVTRAGTDQFGRPDNSDFVQNDEQEMHLLGANRAALEADVQADALVGMAGPATQMARQLEMRMQALARKLGAAAAGSGAMGQYSGMPSGPFP